MQVIRVSGTLLELLIDHTGLELQPTLDPHQVPACATALTAWETRPLVFRNDCRLAGIDHVHATQVAAAFRSAADIGDSVAIA